MIYVVSFSVFSSVIMVLVAMLLVLEATLVRKGTVHIVINDDADKALETPVGGTLLSALAGADIFLPSACGGGGSCGQCRCTVEEGGGDILPTELSHLSRQEQNDNVRLACQLKVREDMRIRIPEAIFSIRKYTATVVSNKNVATFIKELVLRIDNDETIEFEAGQYMQIDIPEYDSVCFAGFDVADRFTSAWEQFDLTGLCVTADEPVFRAYSLANPPYEELLRFTIRIATPPPGTDDIPPGIGSSYVFNLKPGDRVTLSGPYGDFLVKPTGREMCFVGGGAGMAPMRSHILHQLNTEQTKRPITFWYGARSVQEMFYHEEFTKLAEQYDNFSYHVALSDPRPEDNWQGMTGFIHQCLYDHYLKDHADPAEIEYYLCGPPLMIDAVMTMLDELGVEPDMIAYDSFS
ncbi:NADH:ubiquinone reductase (Na(+)-transporting) subunit F [Desulfosudis oleivorans]|uniref:Na(+)-translocating NADH-quinone reductase subunit F n=1 Tax=Desulfosudis oleivorans (strain DSM 6200 / JCM 39069 / Hxd3) TaxID=96561 RepID=A8ZWL4_DESOH|nr:NADH:ubiquinone reductase (Na(+)-transporting) subunit F [Desulfosudis oleivorans]ABW68345.1 NADH:ubiquinone oxidoreductase, subunit F [Desulfosudis oleivorans Hxd3]